MTKSIQYIFFIICSGCAVKSPSKTTSISNIDLNKVNEGDFVQRTLSTNPSIDYSQPLFIFLLIASIVLSISFFPLLITIYKWFYKKILTLFRK